MDISTAGSLLATSSIELVGIDDEHYAFTYKKAFANGYKMFTKQFNEYGYYLGTLNISGVTHNVCFVPKAVCEASYPLNFMKDKSLKKLQLTRDYLSHNPTPFEYKEHDFDPKHLKEHQIITVNYLLSNNHTFIADEQRLGKTAPTCIALDYMLKKRLIRNALIIAGTTSKLQSTWGKAMKEWVGRSVITYGKYGIPRGEIHGCTYSKMKDVLPDHDWVIIDEADNVKNEKTQRFHHFEKICYHAKRVTMITGTPINNTLIDLAVPHYILRSIPIEHTKALVDAGKVEIIAETQRRIQLRRTSSIMNYPYHEKRHIIKLPHNEVLEEYSSKLLQYIDTHMKGIDIIKAMSRVKSLNSDISHHAFMENAEMLNVPFAVKLAKKYIAEGHQVVIYSYHVKVQKAVQHEMKCDAVSSGGKNDMSITRFKSRGKCLAASLKIASDTYDFTPACITIFTSVYYTPRHVAQAEKRVCGMGQKKKEVKHHWFHTTEADRRMINAVMRKQHEIDKVYETEKMDTVFLDWGSIID